MAKRLGRYTIQFTNEPIVAGFGSSAGKKESEGPLKQYFDNVFTDTSMGENTWEAAESDYLQSAVKTAMKRANVTDSDLDGIFSGDLLDQCIASTFGLKQIGAQHIGLFGACSTMALSTIIASIAIDSGALNCAVAATSSHFCSAERQFRFPLEYGGKRTPTSQWTVTGSGALVLKNSGQGTANIKYATLGRMVDYDITDANNMGAAMAPAAADTISRFFSDTGLTAADFDLILTGDLGQVGAELLDKLIAEKGFDIREKHRDCGIMIYNLEDTDVQAGGSGCGCSASVLCSYIMKQFEKSALNRILFCATGALMSPTSSEQGLSIPGIAHAVVFER
ncbi:MAG: stage V sporulation protein AD [Acutalibacteraceae bacterium]|nr:stage V sporulation protein AD [Acutalibacteraceae bacterium]